MEDKPPNKFDAKKVLDYVFSDSGLERISSNSNFSLLLENNFLKTSTISVAKSQEIVASNGFWFLRKKSF